MTSLAVSLSILPQDAHRRVLNALDWRSIARCACVSRNLNQLVKEIQAIPVWRTGVFASQQDEAELGKEVSGLVEKLRFSARPDLCVVFVSRDKSMEFDYSLRADPVTAALNRELPGCCSIVVSKADTIIGGSEVEPPVEEGSRSTIVSVSLIHIPLRAHLRVGVMRRHSRSDLGQEFEGVPQDAHMLLLMASSNTIATTWKHMMAEHMPDASTAGGMCSGRGVSVCVAAPHAPPAKRAGRRRIQTCSCVALVFYGPNVETCSFSARGFRPRGRGHLIKSIVPRGSNAEMEFFLHRGISIRGDELSRTIVNGVTSGRILRQEGRRGWEFQADGTAEGESDMNAAIADLRRSNFHVAIPAHDEAGFSREFCLLEEVEPFEVPGDLADSVSLINVEGRTPPGTLLSGVTFTKEQAEQDFGDMLEVARGRLQQDESSSAVLGCFMMACLGRGFGLYECEGKEASLLGAAFPGIPIAGFFANGEYGPAPLGERFLEEEKSRTLIWTTVLTFVRLKAADTCL